MHYKHQSEPNKRGLIIAIEGLPKSGKSTQVNYLVNYLRGIGRKAISKKLSLSLQTSDLPLQSFLVDLSIRVRELEEIVKLVETKNDVIVEGWVHSLIAAGQLKGVSRGQAYGLVELCRLDLCADIVFWLHGHIAEEDKNLATLYNSLENQYISSNLLSFIPKPNIIRVDTNEQSPNETFEQLRTKVNSYLSKIGYLYR